MDEFDLHIFYKIYGLYLRTNIELPILPEIYLEANTTIDIINICLGPFPGWIQKLLVDEKVSYYNSPEHQQDGNPHITVDTLNDGKYFHFKYKSRVEFILNRTTTDIWGTWQDNLTLSDAVLYLLGPILGFILRLRGTTCLHASCIAIDDKAFALVGVSGSGKSTTAAAFAIRGYPIISDDVTPLAEIDGAFQVVPGYPRLRLWSDSVEALFGTPDAQPLLTPNYGKRYLDLNSNHYNFRSYPISLNAIYILNPRCNDPIGPFIITESRKSGLFLLAANTYRNELLDKRMRQQEFDVLSRLVTHVPLRQITPHNDIAKLPELCDKLLEDFQTLA
jgi:hypothetical protein